MCVVASLGIVTWCGNLGLAHVAEVHPWCGTGVQRVFDVAVSEVPLSLVIPTAAWFFTTRAPRSGGAVLLARCAMLASVTAWLVLLVCLRFA